MIDIIMERRITKKVEEHQREFKNAIKKFLEDNECQVRSVKNNDTDNSEFLKFVYDFENFNLSKDDFKKRKRVKNQVPQFERCSAKRANCEQCTRRRKDDSNFCGTHIKGTPHGVLDTQDIDIKKTTKIDVWVKEIKGINYYVDAANNVYMPGDILSNLPNPRKIGKYELTSHGTYHIPGLDSYVS